MQRLPVLWPLIDDVLKQLVKTGQTQVRILGSSFQNLHTYEGINKTLPSLSSPLES